MTDIVLSLLFYAFVCFTIYAVYKICRLIDWWFGIASDYIDNRNVKPPGPQT